MMNYRQTARWSLKTVVIHSADHVDLVVHKTFVSLMKERVVVESVTVNSEAIDNDTGSLLTNIYAVVVVSKGIVIDLDEVTLRVTTVNRDGTANELWVTVNKDIVSSVNHDDANVEVPGSEGNQLKVTAVAEKVVDNYIVVLIAEGDLPGVISKELVGNSNMVINKVDPRHEVTTIIPGGRVTKVLVNNLEVITVVNNHTIVVAHSIDINQLRVQVIVKIVDVSDKQIDNEKDFDCSVI